MKYEKITYTIFIRYVEWMNYWFSKIIISNFQRLWYYVRDMYVEYALRRVTP